MGAAVVGGIVTIRGGHVNGMLYLVPSGQTIVLCGVVVVVGAAVVVGATVVAGATVAVGATLAGAELPQPTVKTMRPAASTRVSMRGP